LPDAGHLMMAEYPDVVNYAIADLIKKFTWWWKLRTF
jgi:hypothetical protein